MENTNVGLFKEEQMVVSLNNKLFSELSGYLRLFITKLYGIIQENDLIKAEIVPDYQKPDFCVTVNEVTHYISMKNGVVVTLQQLDIDKFCLYLKENKISNETIETIRLFHYGDGTLDGTGKERLDYQSIMPTLAKCIARANFELNRNKAFVWQTVEKCIFKGFSEEKIPAEFLYFGDTEDGYIVSNEIVKKEVCTRYYGFYDNLHVGPILFRPHARYAGKKILNEKYRRSVDFYWPNLESIVRRADRRYNTTYVPNKYKH